MQQEGCDFIVEEQFSSAQMDGPEFQKSFKVFVNEKIFEWVFNIIKATPHKDEAVEKITKKW